MGESWGSRNSTSSGVENQLKTTKLRARKVKKELGRYIVNLGMNERRGNGLSSMLIKSVSDSPKVSNG